MKTKIAQHPLNYWLKRNVSYLVLFPFSVTALCLALISLQIAATLSDTIAIFFAIVIVGVLAAGGVVINIVRDPRKRKHVERTRYKRHLSDMDAQTTSSDDIDTIEGLAEKPKRKTKHY